MQTNEEIIGACLELVSERSEDIAPAVYQKFFKQYPQARELFALDDYDVHKNSMIISLLLELMNFSSGCIYEDNVRRWIYDHVAYGVTLPMYDALLSSLEQVIVNLLADDWTIEMNQAWQAQFGVLRAIVADVYSDSNIS